MTILNALPACNAWIASIFDEGSGSSKITSPCWSTPRGNVTSTARDCRARLRAKTLTLPGSHSILWTGRLRRMSRPCLVDGAMQQGRVAFVDVEVRLEAGDVGLEPAFEREHRRFHGMIVLEQLLDVSLRDSRSGQQLRALRRAKEFVQRGGPPSRAAKLLRQKAEFAEQLLRRTGQLGVRDELAVKPGVSLAHVGNQSQPVLAAELMHDGVFAVHEFRPELDRVPREGAPGEMRPPMRFRASTQMAVSPERTSSRMANTPAAPAPITMTSARTACSRGRLR